MKIDKMPTTVAVVIFSWLTAIFGIVISITMIVLRYNGIKSLIIAAIILFSSLFIAVIVRMFANIGQMLFDLKRCLEQINCYSRDISDNMHQIRIFFERIERHLDLRK